MTTYKISGGGKSTLGCAVLPVIPLVLLLGGLGAVVVR